MKNDELENILVYDIPKGKEPLDILISIFGKAMSNWNDLTDDDYEWKYYKERYIYKIDYQELVYRSNISIKNKINKYKQLKKISYNDFVEKYNKPVYDENKGWNI